MADPTMVASAIRDHSDMGFRFISITKEPRPKARYGRPDAGCTEVVSMFPWASRKDHPLAHRSSPAPPQFPLVSSPRRFIATFATPDEIQ